MFVVAFESSSSRNYKESQVMTLMAGINTIVMQIAKHGF